MATKHTPGPWTADRDLPYGVQPRVSSPERLVAVVGNTETDRQDQWEADASLIAAAPDLLQALRGMLVVHETCHERPAEAGSVVLSALDRRVAAAHAAITKATEA